MSYMADQPLIALAFLVALWFIVKMSEEIIEDEETKRKDVIFSIGTFVLDIIILVSISYLSDSWLVQAINITSIVIICIVIYRLCKCDKIKKEKA